MRGRLVGNDQAAVEVVVSTAAHNGMLSPCTPTPPTCMQVDDEARKQRAEARFNEWVRWKDRFDRGLELFGKLDASRAEADVSACVCSHTM